MIPRSCRKIFKTRHSKRTGKTGSLTLKSRDSNHQKYPKGLDKNASSHRMGEGIPNLYNQQNMYFKDLLQIRKEKSTEK